MTPPTITELRRLTGPEVDHHVRLYLRQPCGYSTTEDKDQLQRRAIYVTSLRTNKVWPRDRKGQ